MLSRAQSALVRLQTLLNSIDISVSAPECFHDIIRICRNCHDLDKILQSSYFNDPELQSLIAQAKLEIKRGKANKISKHLSQLFDSWSKSTESADGRSFGTLAVGDRTIKVGTSKSGTTVNVSIHIPNTLSGNGSVENGIGVKSEKMPAVNGDDAVLQKEGNDISGAAGKESLESNAGESNLSEWEGRALRKEYSEPVINQLCEQLNGEALGRRPSDPVVETLGIGSMSKSKTLRSGSTSERNMVGENCVGKAAKRTKSDSVDENGVDIKKSREDSQEKNLVAQELCFKICQSLQRQIYKIHEEVNKRTKRLLSSEENAAATGINEGKVDGEGVVDDSTQADAETCTKADGGDVMTPSQNEDSAEMPSLTGLPGQPRADSERTLCENGISESPKQDSDPSPPPAELPSLQTNNTADGVHDKTDEASSAGDNDNSGSANEDECRDLALEGPPTDCKSFLSLQLSLFLFCFFVFI